MENVKLVRLVLGPISTNCYLLMNEVTSGIIVIDPAASADEILDTAKELGGTITAILLTHGHYDHIGAVAKLAEQTGAGVWIHREEQELLRDSAANLSEMQSGKEVTIQADHLVEDGDLIEEGGLSCKVLFTPGHTKGGCCYYFEKEGLLFSGDTLFDHSVGRTDFPTGSMEVLLESIRTKLFSLPDETWVLPGHGGISKIGIEKLENPFVREI